MKRKEIAVYELMLLLKHPIQEDQVQQQIQFYKQLIEAKARIVIVNNYGSRLLPYMITKCKKGTILQFIYPGSADLRDKLKIALSRDELLLRGLTRAL